MVGFFSFILLLCCESATASFRAALVPIHSTFGITTFVMAVATACSGLTEKAFFTLRYIYILLLIIIYYFEAVPNASNKVIYDRVKRGTVKNNNFEIPAAFLFFLTFK